MRVCTGLSLRRPGLRRSDVGDRNRDLPADQCQEGFTSRLKRAASTLPQRIWYQGHWLGPLLAPIGWLYCGLACLRRWLYQRGWLASYSVPAPVIVVGNLTVGGTGKTPLVLWLAHRLSERGRRPGIALRGYRGREAIRGIKRHAGGSEPASRVPVNGDPNRFGDEAVLLADRAGCPVVVSRDRVAAARALVEEHGCDLVLTDDGLQHYRLQRELEILVVDGERGFGNRRCLPAGPLREPAGRRRQVDLMIENGGSALGAEYRMHMKPAAAVSLVDPSRRCPVADFTGGVVTAVAGIGNPQRFFAMLRGLGLTIEARPYPDHYRYNAADLMKWPDCPVLMTEKDAVKCRSFAGPAHWYIPVTAVPETRFTVALDKALDRCLAQASASSDYRHRIGAERGADSGAGKRHRGTSHSN
jgi:tetraacyldisaccharide 4'-kinase